MTCNDCRFFGRDHEPLPADQTFDKVERMVCKERSGSPIVIETDIHKVMVYVAADRTACDHFEEESDGKL